MLLFFPGERTLIARIAGEYTVASMLQAGSGVKRRVPVKSPDF